MNFQGDVFNVGSEVRNVSDATFPTSAVNLGQLTRYIGNGSNGEVAVYDGGELTGGGVMTLRSVQIDCFAQIGMDGNFIRNMADGVAATDAATVGQVFLARDNLQAQIDTLEAQVNALQAAVAALTNP
jgi:hypothetical protein